MRCNKLYVTPEGQDILHQFADSFDELNNAMFEGFSEAELKQLEDFSERVNNNLEKFMNKKED